VPEIDIFRRTLHDVKNVHY